MSEPIMRINCAHTDMVDVDALVPHPRNPNRHSDSQLRLLAKVMAHQGWRNPIVVSKRSGFIIKGHGRLAAARLNGWSEAPVDRQHYDTEADEWADMVADNRIAELAELDVAATAELLAELGDNFDAELAGFDADGLAGLEKISDLAPDGAKEISEDEFARFKHMCPRCGFEFDTPIREAVGEEEAENGILRTDDIGAGSMGRIA